MILRYIVSPLVPVACYRCGRPGVWLCPACLRSAILPYGGRCYMCMWGRRNGACCIDCSRRTPLSGVTVTAGYAGLTPKLIYTLKHEPDVRLAKLFASLMARRLLMAEVTCDMVVPIPTAPARYRERGYNQTELMSSQLAGLLGQKHVKPLMRLSSRHQIGLNRRERLDRIGGVFTVVQPDRVVGRRIVLVDDVMTTGATLSEAARALRASGAESVWGCVVARA